MRDQHRSTAPRILIVDDDPEACQLVAKLLEDGGLSVAGICHDGIEAIEQVMASKPDIVLLDLSMPRATGIEVLEQLRDQHLPVSVIVVTAYGDPASLRKAIDKGANGYLTKLELKRHLISAIAMVLAGDFAVIEPSLLEAVLSSRQTVELRSRKMGADAMEPLTDRETTILELIAMGYDNKAIAEKLHISYNTVKSHTNSIYGKLDVSDRTQAALVAYRSGLGSDFYAN
ncbi:MAG: response regulator transcription factor [Anaerolineales bacterium]